MRSSVECAHWRTAWYGLERKKTGSMSDLLGFTIDVRTLRLFVLVDFPAVRSAAAVVAAIYDNFQFIWTESWPKWA